MGSRALLIVGRESNLCTTNSQSHYEWNYEDLYNEPYPNRFDYRGNEEKVPKPLSGFTSHQPASATRFTGTLPPPPAAATGGGSSSTGHIHR